MDKADIIIIILSAIIIILLTIILIKMLKKQNSNSDFSDAEIENKIKKANDDQEKRILDDNSRIKSDIQQIQLNTNKELAEFKEKMNSSIDDKFKEVNKTLTEGILKISESMNKNVTENFEKTNQTFSDIKERMAKIDEAQKNLQNVENSITSFREVLENKKARGNFGEFQLNSLLQDVFGEKQEVYQIQATLPNGSIADSLLLLPDPLGRIVIDSKFPFDNYKKINDPNLSAIERDSARKLFKTDIKKHIDDISSKYIIKNYTSEQAIMFIPSEAVFAEINANFTESVQYGQKMKVWITSPTTLMSVLETVQIMLRDAERSKNAKALIEQLNMLSEDFRRYAERWKKFNSSLSTVVSDAKDIKITTDKISTRFNNINNHSSSIDLDDEEDKEDG